MRVTALLLAMLTFAADRLPYPSARRSDHVDQLHGVQVPDPYRWMEDNGSAELKAWIAAQNELTSKYLASIPQRPTIRKRVEELTRVLKHPPYASSAGVLSRNGTLFFLRLEPQQNQAVLMMRPPGKPARPLLDPNGLSRDGTVALISWNVSPDGNWLAYGLSSAGSDWQEMRVRSTGTGQDLPEVLKWVKFTEPSWSADSKGFYYARYPAPEGNQTLTGVNAFQKVYHHTLRSPQSDDKLVYERLDHKEWMFSAEATEDGAYLIINVVRGAGEGKNLIFYRDLKTGRTVELIPEFEDEYFYLANQGSVFLFQTTYQAPRGRIIAIHINQPERGNWREIVPQNEWALQESTVFGGKLALHYLRDASSFIRTADLRGGGVKDVPLPAIGTARLPRATNDASLYISFMSFTTPELIYKAESKLTPLETGSLPYDPSHYETRQVFYKSKDGTRVPMFIVHRKGLKLDGKNPTLLYGYGGFSVSLTPLHNSLFATWLDLGGVFASANLRGGAEYGREWHEAGTKLRKQNVFDDFIAAAEWLAANGYTSASQLGIMGGSNGGLLVGAVLNQRPELFGAAVPAVGVMDMLRFHKFTIGAAWTSDYGSPDKAEEFRALRAYSPVHNIRKGTAYPPTMVVTSDHDDRVVPAHSFKYAAAMQYAQEGAATILARVETSAGHGAGKPRTKQIEESADILTFLAKSLGLNVDH